MKNSDALEKSKGVVLFAANTETVDYISIARRAERLINYYLGLPVTILDSNSQLKNFRSSVDSLKPESWANGGRYRAYELSPYDQTILLDSDYLVFGDNLLKILDTVEDYKIANSNRYLSELGTHEISSNGLKTLWATIIAFNRTPKSKMFFDLVGRIERNYSYYQRLYNLNAYNFRNDYAFTIADHILNGYKQDTKNYIPWTMLTVSKPIESLALVNSKFHIKTDGKAYAVPKQDIHIMSKQYLLSDECDNLIKSATDA